MKKAEIIEKTKMLDLPQGEYVVVGSGLLGVLGLREVNDVDLVVSPDILGKFEKKEDWQKEVKWGKTFLSKKNFDMFSQLAWEKYQTTREEAIMSARHIGGVPFMNVKETIAFKQALGREKDHQDIALLRSSQESGEAKP